MKKTNKTVKMYCTLHRCFAYLVLVWAMHICLLFLPEIPISIVTCVKFQMDTKNCYSKEKNVQVWDIYFMENEVL